MYVVMGATGNTGKMIADELLAQGQQVRAIGRNQSRLRSLADKGAEPFVADATDRDALRAAFSEAKAVYAMIPPDPGNPDVTAYQRRVGEAIASALERSAVQYVVSLSSIGADKPSGTGPVVGLHDFEQRLNQMPGVNVLHLRPGFFMENLLAQIQPIRGMGMIAGTLDGNLQIPMIATRDIGQAAADALLELEFKGRQTRELLGQCDVTMGEAAGIIGKAIGMPTLEYRRISNEQLTQGLVKSGASPSMANLLVEMFGAMNSGHMRALEQRSPKNTTPTSFEIFVDEKFVPAYKRLVAA